LGALRSLNAWFSANQIKGLVIGDVAASFLGRARLTADVDALVLLDESRWEQFLRPSAVHGLVPRHPDALAFAREVRMLLLRHDASGVNVDVAMGALPFEEEAVARGTARDVGGVVIPLPTPEDLIIMKAVAHRDKDLIDIQSVLDRNPKVDKRRIRRWVREFANALAKPELLDDLERLLTRRRGSKRRANRS
jgi:hypothetical protein